MRIELRDRQRTKIGRIEVDPALRPTRVTVVGSGREVFLDWDTAIDDGGHLRRCVACECRELFREKAFPQITGFVVVLAFAGAAIGALGLVTTPILIGMAVVLVLDVAILLFSRRRLVCYGCRTSYHGLEIARYHRTWERALAERHPAHAPSPAAGPASSSTPLARHHRFRPFRPFGRLRRSQRRGAALSAGGAGPIAESDS